MKLKNTFFALVMLVGLCFISSGCRAQITEQVDWSKAFYVSPSGNDKDAGTKDKPFATVKQALAALPDSGGGVVALLDGTYDEQVTVRQPEVGRDAASLLITAAPGAKVLFQGGKPITEWTSYNGEAGMYVVHAPDREGMFGRTGFLDVWENTARVRYRIQFDADGVRAYPGSACQLDEERILIHTRDGRDPKVNNLWRNRFASSGISINRDNVTLRGLSFENYLGGAPARAITVGGNAAPDYRGVRIERCTFTNCVRGISMTADGAHVTDSHFQEVGQGMVTYGVDTVVENCTFQSASGLFSISDLNQHARDGVRFYYDANGGAVRNSITAGFWTGIYIKSRTDNPDVRPILLENNIILDGIFPGIGTYQPRVTYLSNIIGPNEEYYDPMRSNLTQPATWENNYFFAGGAKAGVHINQAKEVSDPNKGIGKPGIRKNNVVGENPFANLAGGDLSIKPGMNMPSAHAPRRIDWNGHLATKLKSVFKMQEAADPVLNFVKEPIVTASARGAIAVVELTTQAKSTFYYRKMGETQWQNVKATDNMLTVPETVVGSAPVEIEEPNLQYKVLFALTNKELEPNTEYEYYVEASEKDGSPLRSATRKLRTDGAEKQIFVRANSDAKTADGTESKPFAQLQDALNRALPGDTIVMAKGVYIEPAVLVHGGLPNAPITITGAGARETILDGGKVAPYILELRNAPHVKIRDIQVRWFGNAGIYASRSEQVSVERSHFFNAALSGSGSPNGSGIYIADSPRWTITHSLFAKMEHGILATRSPQITLLHNTAYQNMYDGAALHLSLENSVVKYNSFTFTGNDSLSFSEKDREPLASLQSDYNNWGTMIRAGETRPENDFKAAERYGQIGTNKAMLRATIDGKMHRFSRLADWRKFSGQGQHTIFDDPQYVDPLNLDFRLMPDSPNILPDGKVIGAFGVAER